MTDRVDAGIIACMHQFDHERMEVYGVALAFVKQATAIRARLPRGRNPLADQLDRASVSVALNIAEGAGEFARKEKARFYRIARRSATDLARWTCAPASHCRHADRDGTQTRRFGFGLGLDVIGGYYAACCCARAPR